MSAELPDFTTAEYWTNRKGSSFTASRCHILADSFPDSMAEMAPWTPLMTAKDWAKQRDDLVTAAAELSERTLMTASEAMAVLIAATDWIGAEKLTREGWVQRIDRDKLAGVIKSVLDRWFDGYSGGHGEIADAVLAALPELMGGGSDE